MTDYDTWKTTEPEPRLACLNPECPSDASDDLRNEGYCSSCADELRAQARGDI